MRLLIACAGLAWSILGQAATFIVNVGGDSPPTFSPQTITIQKGDTIAFINRGGLHNVVADDSSFRCARGCDGKPGGNGNTSGSNWVASVTFNTLGTIGYYCEQHGAPGQGMFGTIHVQAPTTPVRLQAFSVD
jgi:plastocyanin